MRLDNFDEEAYNQAMFSGIETVTFTGTQVGMTRKQQKNVAKLLQKMSPSLVLHGDCIGADSQFHTIAREQQIDIHIRPCTIENKRAFTDGKILAPPEDPIARNHKMVDQSDAVIAAPKGEETLRSGTWATVRYAKKIGISVWVIFPDGTLVTPDGNSLKY